MEYSIISDLYSSFECYIPNSLIIRITCFCFVIVVVVVCLFFCFLFFFCFFFVNGFLYRSSCHVTSGLRSVTAENHLLLRVFHVLLLIISFFIVFFFSLFFFLFFFFFSYFPFLSFQKRKTQHFTSTVRHRFFFFNFRKQAKISANQWR